MRSPPPPPLPTDPEAATRRKLARLLAMGALRAATKSGEEAAEVEVTKTAG